MVTIKAYNAQLHADRVHGLWQRALAPQWTLPRDGFGHKLATATVILVAEEAGVPVGFCAAGHDAGGKAGLLAILVDPTRQRVGIGSQLLAALEERLRAENVHGLALGCGSPGGYFWPGVPTDGDAAWSFFAAHGWTESERSYDLAVDLKEYRTPSWVYERTDTARIGLSLATAQDHAALIEFERRHFPDWAVFFEAALAKGDYNNVLLAKTCDGVIAGSVALGGRDDVLWNQVLGGDCGLLGILGVDDSRRDAGIGLALAARSLELLQERGLTRCYIGWTWLVDWYGKLGAYTWAEYRMSEKRL